MPSLLCFLLDKELFCMKGNVIFERWKTASIWFSLLVFLLLFLSLSLPLSLSLSLSHIHTKHFSKILGGKLIQRSISKSHYLSSLKEASADKNELVPYTVYSNRCFILKQPQRKPQALHSNSVITTFFPLAFYQVCTLLLGSTRISFIGS